MPRNDQTPRDLLFGLLALQVGLIDQDQLVAAFGAWSRSRGRALAEILIERGSIDAESRTLLDGMARKQLERHGGEAERSLAAVAPGPATLARLAALGDAELTSSVVVVGTRTPAGPDDSATMTLGDPTGGGQRFRILRPHARGGLGAVSVALDGELNREVALKQILDHHADDPVSRARFLLEAEITGGLEHPGIVPVYGLGHDGDGRPYYAMRFIRGDSMRDAVDTFHRDAAAKDDPGRRSLALRELLRRFVDVCDAIAYAHGRGVLHRDLKPANVVVGKHGETLVVDWGLAKPMGHSEATSGGDERTLIPSSSGGSAETLPGSAIGTPAYMSPEQAAGDLDRLGPPSDVYSLGATLYYLLAGRAAFEGNVGDVLRRVKEGDFPGPRKLDPSIDPPLEAICLKAMSAKPPDRYPTAKALGEDLERWMADEPVDAYPEPFRRRAARWERRHKLLVAGTVIVLAITSASLAALGLVVSREKAATEAARIRALAAADQANQGFDIAGGAVFRLLSEVADQKFNKIPNVEEIRKSLAKEASSHFDSFLRKRPDDVRLLRDAARVYKNLGVIYWMIGDFDAARETYRKALAAEEKIMEVGPENLPDALVRLAAIHRDLGLFLFESGHEGEAATYLAKARALLDPMLANLGVYLPSTQNEVRRAAGWDFARQGDCQLEGGSLDEAEASFRRGIEWLEPVQADSKEWYWYRLFVAQCHRGLGQIAASRRDSATADREFAEALRRARAVVGEVRDADPRDILANTLRWDAERLVASSAPGPRAEAELTESIGLLEQACREFPAATWFRRDLALALLARGRHYSSIGRDGPAESDLLEARRLLAGLVSGSPPDRAFSALLGRVLLAQGRHRLRQGRPDEARAPLADAVARLEAARNDRPGNVLDRESLAEAFEALREAKSGGVSGAREGSNRP